MKNLRDFPKRATVFCRGLVRALTGISQGGPDVYGSIVWQQKLELFGS